jgi:hypothetical protein
MKFDVYNDKQVIICQFSYYTPYQPDMPILTYDGGEIPEFIRYS